MGEWWNGIHATLKMLFLYRNVGPSHTSPTKKAAGIIQFFLFKTYDIVRLNTDYWGKI